MHRSTDAFYSMLAFVRSLLTNKPPLGRDNIDITADLETGPDPDPIAPIGWDLTPSEYSDAVPWAAGRNGRDYDDFCQRFEFVSHKDGESIIVFPEHFMYDNPITGEVVYNEIAYRPEDDPRGRLEETKKVYEWLFKREGGERSHPRIVHYQGALRPQGFLLLQRLTPGPMPMTKSKGEGEYLELYWRWAVQLLTGLSFLHERGVYMGSFDEEALWIREDFSIAIACLLGAGCQAVNVPVALYEIHTDSPWHDLTGEPLPDEDWEACQTRERFGCVKADLVDWAVIVFRWMTGGDDDFLRFHNNQNSPVPEIKDEISRRWRTACRYRGDLIGFRRLEKKTLGDVIVDCLMGKFDSAEEVLCEVRKTVFEFGGVVGGDLGDEVVGLEGRFEVVTDEGGRQELRLRQESDVVDEKCNNL